MFAEQIFKISCKNKNYIKKTNFPWNKEKGPKRTSVGKECQMGFESAGFSGLMRVRVWVGPFFFFWFIFNVVLNGWTCISMIHIGLLVRT